MYVGNRSLKYLAVQAENTLENTLLLLISDKSTGIYLISKATVKQKTNGSNCMTQL